MKGATSPAATPSGARCQSATSRSVSAAAASHSHRSRSGLKSWRRASACPGSSRSASRRCAAPSARRPVWTSPFARLTRAAALSGARSTPWARSASASSSRPPSSRSAPRLLAAPACDGSALSALRNASCAAGRSFAPQRRIPSSFQCAAGSDRRALNSRLSISTSGRGSAAHYRPAPGAVNTCPDTRDRTSRPTGGGRSPACRAAAAAGRKRRGADSTRRPGRSSDARARGTRHRSGRRARPSPPRARPARSSSRADRNSP